MLIATAFVIIWEIFYGTIPLNSVLLLLLNFVSEGSGRNWCIHCSSQISGQVLLIFIVFSCLCCCHFSEKSFFVCTNRINLLNLKQSSDRLVIVANGVLKLPNLHMLIKQRSLVFQIVESWKVSSVFPLFTNVGKRSTAKNYLPVSLLSVVSEVLENL